MNLGEGANFKVDGWAAQVQVTLKPGRTAEHCYDALADIIWGCFNSQAMGDLSYFRNVGLGSCSRGVVLGLDG
jgi:hypothetical protein